MAELHPIIPRQEEVLSSEKYVHSKRSNVSMAHILLDELTGLVGQFVGAIPQMERVLGKGSVPKRHWLDIDFPDGPPPEYERKGFELPLPSRRHSR